MPTTTATYELPDLGGGLHDGQPATHIAQSEWAELENWYPDGTEIKRRGGIARVNNPDFGFINNLVSGGVFQDAAGVSTIFVNSGRKMGYLSGSSLIAIPDFDSAGVDSLLPWTYLQYLGVGYVVRAGMPVMRFTPSGFGRAGIVRPGTAPVTSNGGAGNMEAGDRQAVVSFANSVTGAESDFSPVSNITTLGANAQLNITSIPTPTDFQTDSRRVYITQANQPGTFYLAVVIPDRTTTAVTVNSTVDDLGAIASEDNGVPTSQAKFGALWKERLWLSDGTDLFYSEAGKPESFGPNNVYSPDPTSGRTHTGLINLRDDFLVLAHTDRLVAIREIGNRLFDKENITDRFGCVANATLKVINGELYWFSGTDFCKTSGAGAQRISDTRIRTLLARIPSAEWGRAVSGVLPSKNWYITALADPAHTNINTPVADYNTTMVVYNYKTGRWCIFRRYDAAVTVGNVQNVETPGSSPNSFIEYTDSTGADRLYCTLNNTHLYQMESGDRDRVIHGYDGSVEVKCAATTKCFSAAQAGKSLAVKAVDFLSDVMGGKKNGPNPDDSIEVLVNGRPTGHADNVTTPWADALGQQDSTTPLWRRVTMGGAARRAAPLLQLRFTTRSLKAVNLQALVLHVLEVTRRLRGM